MVNGQNKMMEQVSTREDLEFELLNAQINATSPYNDGWTQQGYKERVVELKKKLKSIGKQLKFDF
jgi:hypothetical protein